MTFNDNVRKRILQDLEDYFKAAEESEDPETQANTSIEERVEDFYKYTTIARNYDLVWGEE